MEIISDPQFHARHEYKLAAMLQTIAVPVTPSLQMTENAAVRSVRYLWTQRSSDFAYTTRNFDTFHGSQAYFLELASHHYFHPSQLTGSTTRK